VTRGLRTGAADIDGDGLVSVDDMYEYARRQLAAQPQVQNPRKWEFDVAGTIVLARSPTAAEPGASPPARSLPAVLSPVFEIAAPGPTRIRQTRWWLGLLLFLATAVVLSVLLMQWIFDWLYFLGLTDQLPSDNAGRLAAGLGGAAWAVAFGAVDAARSSPAHWYDLLLRWLATLRQVFQPSGWRQFLQAVRAAVPLNVALTLVASVLIGAFGYDHWGGSQGRDKAFPLAFTVLTALAVATYLTSEQRKQRDDA
jgi:hypothetical protein